MKKTERFRVDSEWINPGFTVFGDWLPCHAGVASIAENAVFRENSIRPTEIVVAWRPARLVVSVSAGPGCPLGSFRVCSLSSCDRVLCHCGRGHNARPGLRVSLSAAVSQTRTRPGGVAPAAALALRLASTE